MGGLTTHILDTTIGRPARGVVIELQRREGDDWRTLTRTVSNADGRCDAPLLSEESDSAGVYQLLFHVGEYFRGAREAGASPFLDVVPVRFTIAAGTEHYHVPLLVTPWSYAAYRGS